ESFQKIPSKNLFKSPIFARQVLRLRRTFWFQTRLPMFTEPRYVFAYYTASLYKRACPSEFWVKHTNIGRKCRQKFAKTCDSIVFECYLAHGLWGERAARMC